MNETMTPTKPSHAKPKIARWGRHVMLVGAAVFFLPLVLPKADGLADAHELWRHVVSHLWWQLAGATVFTLGTTLRLIGLQGHPGLPFPPFMRRLPHDFVAGVHLRRRAFENRARALAGEISSAPRSRWRFRVRARRAARLHGAPLPRCLLDRHSPVGAAG
jgi:hypothetical protein